jgi:hypothetical protein
MFLSNRKTVMALVLVLAVLAAPKPAVAAAPPASTAAPAAKEIDRLVAELGSDDYQTREAAHKKLEKIGEAALPALEKALTSKDLEVRRRARMIVEPLRKRIRERLAEKLLATATGGGIDVLVESLVVKGAAATRDDWDRLQKVVAAIVEKSGKRSKYDLASWRVMPAARLLHGKAIAEDEVKDPMINSGALVARGRVTGTGWIGAVLFANGNVTLTGGIDCLIVCDGDVTLTGCIRCVAVASGSIKDGGSIDCLLAARGPVQSAGSIRTMSKEKQKVPLQTVKFFEPAQLGAEVALADGKVRVRKVKAGTPLAKAGLRAGDIVTALGETKVESVEAFRRTLRRKLAEGRTVVKVRRGDRMVELPARLLD